MVKNIIVGQEVWIKPAIKGIVTDVYDNEPEGFVRVACQQEDFKVPFATVKVKDCYLTRLDLEAAFTQGYDKQIEAYRNTLWSEEALIRFCYKHNFSSEPINLAAKKAVGLQAKEVFLIDLSIV